MHYAILSSSYTCVAAILSSIKCSIHTFFCPKMGFQSVLFDIATHTLNYETTVRHTYRDTLNKHPILAEEHNIQACAKLSHAFPSRSTCTNSCTRTHVPATHKCSLWPAMKRNNKYQSSPIYTSRVTRQLSVPQHEHF